MKNILLSITCIILLSSSLFAQQATDSNGNKVYNGASIAIFTRIQKYEFNEDGGLKNVISTKEENEIRVAFNVMATTGAQEHGVRVVNRDDDTFRATQKWIEESKSEDYIDGIAVRAKQIGATHLMIQDIIMYDNTKVGMTVEIAYNVISIQTNVSDKMVHKYYMGYNGTGTTAEKMITEEKQAYREYMMYAFPNFFVLQNTKGKTATCAAASLFGIDNTDKAYFYEWQTVDGPIKGKNFSFSKMTLKATGTDPKIVNGLVQFKLDKALASTNNLVIKLGDIYHSELNTYSHIPVAVADFKISGNSFDDYCKTQINNAVYMALSNFDEVNIIENNELVLIKNERELQKTEDFIDGSVIEQFKASGAYYVLRLSEYTQNDQVVNFHMNVVDVESSTIVKDFAINCHISNIDKIVNYYVSLIFVAHCSIAQATDKQLTVYVLHPIASYPGEPLSLLYNKPIKNPMTGETLYNRVVVAECQLSEWNGQEYILRVSNVIDKEDFAKLNDLKGHGLFFLQKNIQEPSEPLKNNSIETIKK